MTRKDYILIADAFRTTFELNQGRDENFKEGVHAVASHVANALQRDNPRFSRSHFMAVIRSEKTLNSRPGRS